MPHKQDQPLSPLLSQPLPPPLPSCTAGLFNVNHQVNQFLTRHINIFLSFLFPTNQQINEAKPTCSPQNSTKHSCTYVALTITGARTTGTSTKRRRKRKTLSLSLSFFLCEQVIQQKRRIYLISLSHQMKVGDAHQVPLQPVHASLKLCKYFKNIIRHKNQQMQQMQHDHAVQTASHVNLTHAKGV